MLFKRLLNGEVGCSFVSGKVERLRKMVLDVDAHQRLIFDV